MIVDAPMKGQRERSTQMFEEVITSEKKTKSEDELLRELADLVAVEKRDERLGFESFPLHEDRIKSILNNLGYAVA